MMSVREADLVEDREVPLGLRLLTLGPSLVGCVLITLSLLLFPTRSGTMFAWRMEPITAIGLGAFYLGGAVILMESLRSPSWIRLRTNAVPVGVHLLLLLPLTWGVRSELVRPGLDTWGAFISGLWFPTLVSAVCGWGAGLYLQSRRSRLDGASSQVPTDRSAFVLRVGLVAVAAVGLPLSAFALIAPQSVASYWPWHLGDPDRLVVGAAGFALTAAAIQAVRVRVLEHVRPLALLIVIPCLGTVAGMFRYHATVSGSPIVVPLVLFLGTAAALTAILIILNSMRQE